MNKIKISTVAYEGWADGNGLLQMQAIKKALFIEKLKLEIKPLKKSVCFSYHHVTTTSAMQMIKIFLLSRVERFPTTVCSKPLDLLLENSDLKATVKKISTGY